MRLNESNILHKKWGADQLDPPTRASVHPNYCLFVGLSFCLANFLSSLNYTFY